MMYHYSPTGNRESIEALGLLVRSPDGTSLAERDGYQAGVYLFHEYHDAELDEGDIFMVDTTGLVLEDDGFHADESVASVSYQPVPAERVCWIKSV